MTSGASVVSNAYCSVDGTDCRIADPTPFSSMWYSHKCKGVRYEVGISNLDGDTVWLYVPFPCDRWPDIKIF